MNRKEAVTAVMAQIREGRIDPALFTANGSWWSNAGASFPIADFNALLLSLHERTEAGITVTPGEMFEFGDRMFFEATSQAKVSDGRDYANRYAFVVNFEGDLIREVREYSDTAHVLAAFDLAL